MSTVSENRGRADVRARSPRGAIEVVTASGRGTLVRMGPAGVAGHTERSLAAEIDAAVAAAQRGTREALRRARAGERRATLDPTSAAGVRRDRARAAVAAVEVTATSPGGVVIVTQTGTGHPRVRLCPGLLKRLNDERLLAEINAALADASRRLAAKILAVHGEHYSAAAARRDRDHRKATT